MDKFSNLHGLSNYYAPQIFTSIVSTGTKHSLLASGIYGVVKVIATSLFVFFFVESLDRRISLIISSIEMGTLYASRSYSVWVFLYSGVSKVTPDMITNLGCKIFLMFTTINIGAMATLAHFLPETKGRGLEEMDVIFGAISAEERAAHIDEQQRGFPSKSQDDKNDTSSIHAKA
ncbi:hypothetical protein H0H93_003049 [Arthromyces matolae]|nr:hypothetical protein H0H93_003049 [Arthromyces matolae]